MTEATKDRSEVASEVDQQADGPDGPRRRGRLVIIVLAAVSAVLLALVLIDRGGDAPDPSTPVLETEAADGEPAAGAPGAEPTADTGVGTGNAGAEVAPYEVQYTEDDSAGRRELLSLDGATLDGPLHLYVGIPEDEADDIEHIELLEGDRVLWRQVSWPFGDKEPVSLDEGEHTVYALLTYDDGTVTRTPDSTFTVGEGSVAAQSRAPVDQSATLEPLGQAVGFGRDVTGGAGGSVYWVTTTDDSGPGSLREAVTRGAPTWVRFAVSGTIDVQGDLHVGSNVTIDGRDARVTISGGGLQLDGVENVIITNVTFKNGGGGVNTDALRLINGTRGVWIHHNTFSDYPDGLVDITRASTDVTVSYNDFSDHEKVMLINGGMDSSDVRPPDEPVKVTIHHNLFDGTFVRNPKARWAHVHLFNNYFRDWGTDGRGSAVHAHTDAEIYSEHNVFEAASESRAIHTTGDTEPMGRISSRGDLLSGGAEIEEHQADDVFDPYVYYDANPDEATQELADHIVDEAGVRR